MTFTETNISALRGPPAPVLLTFDSNEPSQGPFVNVLIQYLQEAAHKTPGSKCEVKGTSTLVLLPLPVQGWCLSTGQLTTFSAGIITALDDGKYEGWIIRTHELAQETFKHLPADL